MTARGSKAPGTLHSSSKGSPGPDPMLTRPYCHCQLAGWSTGRKEVSGSQERAGAPVPLDKRKLPPSLSHPGPTPHPPSRGLPSPHPYLSRENPSWGQMLTKGSNASRDCSLRSRTRSSRVPEILWLPAGWGTPGTHTVSEHPRAPAQPSSLLSGPSCHPGPESARWQCSGSACIVRLGTAQHHMRYRSDPLPCPAAAPRLPVVRHRGLQRPLPGRARSPTASCRVAAPQAHRAQPAQETRPGVCASACSSSPGSPVPQLLPLMHCEAGVKSGPRGLAARG